MHLAAEATAMRTNRDGMSRHDSQRIIRSTVAAPPSNPDRFNSPLKKRGTTLRMCYGGHCGFGGVDSAGGADHAGGQPVIEKLMKCGNSASHKLAARLGLTRPIDCYTKRLKTGRDRRGTAKFVN